MVRKSYVEAPPGWKLDAGYRIINACQACLHFGFLGTAQLVQDQRERLSERTKLRRVRFGDVRVFEQNTGRFCVIARRQLNERVQLKEGFALTIAQIARLELRRVRLRRFQITGKYGGLLKGEIHRPVFLGESAGFRRRFDSDGCSNHQGEN